jgi:hypothetical protein
LGRRQDAREAIWTEAGHLELREAEVDLAKGLTMAQACKKIGVTAIGRASVRTAMEPTGSLRWLAAADAAWFTYFEEEFPKSRPLVRRAEKRPLIAGVIGTRNSSVIARLGRGPTTDAERPFE